ncbi:MAG: hypothetical protein M1540_08610 [Candidatus Bathyarchaeota archaeon]|nr:hypothetical protein [Candidatus Bathyarchaeota archaeon]
MPTIIPGYVYSLFAALIVGVIVVCSCSVATSSIKADAEVQQLRNIGQYVAAQSLTLLSSTSDSQSTTQYLDIPSQVGNQPFWIRIANDSSNAWVEMGFGTNPLSSSMQEKLPATVTASGSFVSSTGRAVLQCSVENQIATLTLTKG